jgi:alkylhydroperoxidase family enzyme
MALASPSTPLPPSAPLDTARIAALQQSAEDAFARFTRQQPAAAALVARARGQSAESDARARALVALADLTTFRSATFVPLGELDALAADAAADFGETAPIAAAQARVLAMIAQQDASLGAMWGELGQ